MKRCTCLSALLVGLSVTVASVASAEEPEPPKGSVKRVAQAQPSDPQPSDSQPAPAAPSDSAAAPQTPAPEETPQPAIQIGTSTQTSDQPSESPATPQKKKERPWANSAIWSLVSMSTSTIFQGQRQYANPTTDAAIWMLPRYALNDAFQLRGRLVFNYEFTNSDTTVTRNEPRFSDTFVQLFYRKIPAVAGIKPQVFIQAAAPTSPESRARTMIFSPGLGFNVAKGFENVAKADVMIVGTVSYSHPIYQNQNAVVRGQRPYPLSCAGGSGCSDLLSGAMNPSDVLVYSALVSASWGKFTPALMYLGASQWVYHPKSDATVPIMGGATTTARAPGDFDRANVRQTSYFAAWLDYEVNTWFTPELGYSMSRMVLTEDASYGNPFWDRYQDTRIYLGANVNVDALVDKMAGGGDDQSGIIRTKNTRRPPMFTY